MKEYYQDNRERIIERVKQYHKENTEVRKIYMKKYREANKGTITQKKKEKITCECGCEIVKRISKQH